MKKILLLIILLPLLSFGENVPRFEIKNGKFLLKGEPIQLICGEMHYPRIPKQYWEDRIVRAKAMGLNTISAYVFWSVHEPEQGKFNFEGQADVAQFVRLAAKHDMFVLLRPGPYVCAEWDYGGYPFWLMEQRDMKIRSRDPKFIDLCAKYLKALGNELAPMSINNGGNIIMVQVENEYGSFAGDKVYLTALRDAILAAGFNAPLMTCDGGGQIEAGHLEGVFPTVNGVVGKDIMTFVDRFQPGGPYFVAEFYPAWFDVWGKRHSKVDLRRPTDQLDAMLADSVSVSLYMFHGGTNFAYTNGANNSNGYEPQPTSYDYDAPLGEWGNAYPKYYAMREVIQKYTKHTLPAVPKDNKRIKIDRIVLDESLPLSAFLERSVECDSVLTMEEMGQDYGYIHYATNFTGGGKLVLRDLRDYAVVYVDGVQVGSLDRRHLQNSLTITSSDKSRKLEILVENVGRVNYGSELYNNRKGITDRVLLGGRELNGWTITSLPLHRETFSGRKFVKDTKKPLTTSGFLRGEFVLNELGDTFVDVSKFIKGAVWVNGHSIGKYWQIGPQQTLYLPAPWLKKGRNEIIVFNMEPSAIRELSTRIDPVLDSLGFDKCRTESPRRTQSKKPILEQGDMIMRDSLAPSNDYQRFVFAEPKTMRHLCVELTSGYVDSRASLGEIEVLDEKGVAVPSDRWTVVYCTSEQEQFNKGLAENALDGDPSTLWLTDASKQANYPYRIIIDLGEIQSVSGVRLLTRTGPSWITAQSKGFTLYGRPQFFLFE